MPLYEFKGKCGHRFEVLKPMSKCREDEICPECGQMASRVLSIFHDLWGWILTEASHHKGATDTWVRDVPSNDPIVYREKAETPKTIY